MLRVCDSFDRADGLKTSETEQRPVFVDLDGTLTFGVSSTRWIFRELGREALFKRLEEAWLCGRLSHAKLAERVVAELAGYHADDLATMALRAPLRYGIAETLLSLRARGYVFFLLTLGFSFVAEAFAKRFGFQDFQGTRVTLRRGKITRGPIRLFTERDKARYLKAHVRRYRPKATIAVGDSRSDRALFSVADFRVALDPDDFLKNYADVALYGRNFGKIKKTLLLREKPKGRAA